MSDPIAYLDEHRRRQKHYADDPLPEAAVEQEEWYDPYEEYAMMDEEATE